MREPSILLFDLGAVLIDISFDRVFASWSEAGNRSAADLKARFSMEASYEAHERVGQFQCGDAITEHTATFAITVVNKD